MTRGTIATPGANGGAVPAWAEPYIEIQNVSVRYGPDQPPVLVDLDLTVAEGEFVCIVGPSGCGKSTLMHTLSGLHPPTKGQVSINGQSLYSGGSGRSMAVGYVFQDHRLLPWRTVRQNLEITLQAAGVSKVEQQLRIERYLKMLQVEEFAGAWPMRLSGGQRQRVAIARALAIEPAFILMDEPFSGLDEVTARTMRQELLDVWTKTGKTIVFVTHSVREAVFLADKVVVLTRGPGRLLTIVDVDVPRPRSPEGLRIAEIEAELVQLAFTHWGIESLA